jgi:hypothetical protein
VSVVRVAMRNAKTLIHHVRPNDGSGNHQLVVVSGNVRLFRSIGRLDHPNYIERIYLPTPYRLMYCVEASNHIPRVARRPAPTTRPHHSHSH